MDLAALYDQHADEYLQFDRIKVKLSNRPDLHALILLDQLVPGEHDIVSAAEHDEIWLSVDPDDLVKVATEAQIVELMRCGVRYDKNLNSFCFFV